MHCPTILLFLCLLTVTWCALKLERKRDVATRRWGAGGMPFSVLYMKPSYTAPKAPATRTQPQRNQQQQEPKKVPQMRVRQKSMSRTPHSVVPQLFVSYGWGPLGKK